MHMRVRCRWVHSISWDCWYLEFEELNQHLDYPVFIDDRDMTVLEECWRLGLVPEEALDNAMGWDLG